MKQIQFTKQELEDIMAICLMLGYIFKPKNQEQRELFDRLPKIADRIEFEAGIKLRLP